MFNEAIAVDSETERFDAGKLAPPLICVSVCDLDWSPVLVDHMNSRELLHELFSQHTLVGANIAYDTCVFVTEFPDLMPVILGAYRDGRVLDVQLAERLKDIARGQLDGYFDTNGAYIKLLYNLAALYERHGHGQLAKDGTPRTEYGQLRGVPVERYPHDFRKYALDDAVATLKVWQSQTVFAGLLKDLPAQARAAFALQLMSVRGVITDARACDEYLEEVKKELDECRKLLEKAEIVRPNGSRDTKRAAELMKDACAAAGIEPKRTAKGGISLDAEICRDVGDETLVAYSKFSSGKTTLQRTQELKSDYPQQTRFIPLVNNGRTSSCAPSPPLVGQNLQNIPRGGKMRQVFTARPGYVFCSVDFTGAELVTFAQVERWTTGRSKLAEAINEGKDCHCVIAADLLGCSYEEAIANKKVGKYAWARQMCKVTNFGALGGMGAETFMAQNNKQATKPEFKMDLLLAKKLLSIWYSRWETRPYFAFIQSLFENSPGRVTVEQFVSGRVRGQLKYTEAANTFFSGLAADAGKAAMWALTEECYGDPKSPLAGSFPLLYIHDEVIAELPEDRAHEAATRMCDVMVAAFQSYVPDVVVRAEPALMKHWFKGADAVYDSEKKLRVWMPKDDPGFAPNKYLKAVMGA